VIGRHTTLLVWEVLGGVLVVCQLVAVMSKGRLPGLGAVAARATTHRVGRYVLVLAWMWLGWHAFAR
jgi:hypothetical protein